MILSYRREDYPVPLTSKCIIHTPTGFICDGANVSVTSPVFASMNFTSGAINTSDQFDVKIKFSPEIREKCDGGLLSTSNLPDEMYGTLHCEDNDTFNMYVTI